MPPERKSEDRQQQPLLMKLSEWASILQLMVVVFGGGALYQKIEYLAETVKETVGQTASLKQEIADSKIEIERLRGKDAVHDLQLQQLMKGR